MEAGSAVQNVCLQAAAMELGTVLIGAFDDDAVRKVLDLSEEDDPLALLPIGRPAEQ